MYFIFIMEVLVLFFFLIFSHISYDLWFKALSFLALTISHLRQTLSKACPTVCLNPIIIWSWLQFSSDAFSAIKMTSVTVACTSSPLTSVCWLSHRLLLMFGVSAGVAVCNYFIPSTLGVVLFSISMGFLLSLDLSQVGTLCRGSQAAFGTSAFRKGGSLPPPPRSFGWILGCRELLLYLTLLLVAMTEAGVLHHFLGSAQSQSLIKGPQTPVSYLLLTLFCLCWTLREIQGAYVFGGMFLNPLYPKGTSCVQTFKRRNRGLYTAAAIRRVLLYLGELVIISCFVILTSLSGVKTMLLWIWFCLTHLTLLFFPVSPFAMIAFLSMDKSLRLLHTVSLSVGFTRAFRVVC